MLIAKVIGTTVSTIKDEKLTGRNIYEEVHASHFAQQCVTRRKVMENDPCVSFGPRPDPFGRSRIYVKLERQVLFRQIFK